MGGDSKAHGGNDNNRNCHFLDRLQEMRRFLQVFKNDFLAHDSDKGAKEPGGIWQSPAAASVLIWVSKICVNIKLEQRTIYR